MRLVVHVGDGRGNVEGGHGEKYGLIGGKSATCGRRGEEGLRGRAAEAGEQMDFQIGCVPR